MTDSPWKVEHGIWHGLRAVRYSFHGPADISPPTLPPVPVGFRRVLLSKDAHADGTADYGAMDEEVVRARA